MQMRGSPFDFVWLSARVPQVGPRYVWWPNEIMKIPARKRIYRTLFTNLAAVARSPTRANLHARAKRTERRARRTVHSHGSLSSSIRFCFLITPHAPTYAGVSQRNPGNPPLFGYGTPAPTHPAMALEYVTTFGTTPARACKGIIQGDLFTGSGQ